MRYSFVKISYEKENQFYYAKSVSCFELGSRKKPSRFIRDNAFAFRNVNFFFTYSSFKNQKLIRSLPRSKKIKYIYKSVYNEKYDTIAIEVLLNKFF